MSPTFHGCNPQNSNVFGRVVGALVLAVVLCAPGASFAAAPDCSSGIRAFGGIAFHEIFPSASAYCDASGAQAGALFVQTNGNVCFYDFGDAVWLEAVSDFCGAPGLSPAGADQYAAALGIFASFFGALAVIWGMKKVQKLFSRPTDA